MIEFRRDSTGKITQVDGDRVPNDYREPDFAEHDKRLTSVHCWLTYITPAMQEIWPTFSDEQKAIIAASAQETADAEDWE
jgi:hypothetical protein